MAGGDHLAGVGPTPGIEGLAQPVLMVEVIRAEHALHEALLLDADAVLAGQHAAGIQ